MKESAEDFSRYFGGQCEIQSRLSEPEGRRMSRGNIKSITVTSTEIEIYFDRYATWSPKDDCWILDKSDSKQLRIKADTNNPSEFYTLRAHNRDPLLIEFPSLDQFMLLYSKDFEPQGKSALLDWGKIEAHQKMREELARLNARASGSSHSDDV